MDGTSKFEGFAWSHTRDQTLAQCARRYYYRYVAAPTGWKHDAAPLARRAYALRHLVTLDLVLGLEVHARAREVASAIRNRRRPPTLAEMRARTRLALNRAWRRRDRAAFLRDPKRHPLLAEHYYRRDVGPPQLQRIRDKLDLCLTSLEDTPVWTDLARVGRPQIRVVDALRRFTVEGIPAYASPDLVYLTAEQAVIVDWKTGYGRDTREQVALYGLFVRHGLRVPFREGIYRARVVHLLDGDETAWDLTGEDLAAAAGRVLTSTEAMRGLVDGGDWTRPLPIEAFPLTRRRHLCPRCPFWELCEEQVRRRAEISGTGESTAPLTPVGLVPEVARNGRSLDPDPLTYG